MSEVSVDHLDDGRVVITGHRWRIDVVTESTEWDREPGARSVVALVVGASGGDAKVDHGGLGALAGPTEITSDRLKANLGKGGQDLFHESGRGGDGVAVVLTRW